jgi:ribosomal protein S18 acetylase RimI-like enzyme
VKPTIENIERHLKEIPDPCRSCLYWEDPTVRTSDKPSPKAEAHARTTKIAWFRKTSAEFGTCGKILFVQGIPVGYAQYAISRRLPKSQEYGSERLTKTEENVAFISCLYIIQEDHRGRGLGKMLLDHVLGDLKARGFKAVETFARRNSANNPSGPIELHLKSGFHVIEELDADFALVRLDF